MKTLAKYFHLADGPRLHTARGLGSLGSGFRFRLQVYGLGFRVWVQI